MSIQASEALGLFFTALRNGGVGINMSDRALANMLADALDTIEPDSDDALDDAGNLAIEIRALVDAELLVDDNGSNY